MRQKRWTTLLLLIVLLAGCDLPSPPANPTPLAVNPTSIPADTINLPPGPKLISDSAFWNITIGGHYAFWSWDRRDPHQTTIHGYDLQQGREFIVTDTPGVQSRGWLQSDGKTLVWAEAPPTTGLASWKIIAYDIAAKQQRVLFEVGSTLDDTPSAYLQLLENGILYYTESGYIYSLNISSGEKKQLRSEPLSYEVKISHGYIAWRDDETCGIYCQPIVKLGVGKLDDSSKDRIVISGTEFIDGYDLSGPNVVYAYGWSHTDKMDIYLHNVDTDSSKVIASGPVSSPIIKGNTVVWARYDASAPVGAQPPMTLQSYYIGNSADAYDIASSPVNISLEPVTLIAGNTLVFSLNEQQQTRFYFISAEQHNVSIPPRFPIHCQTQIPSAQSVATLPCQ